jgi:hypothetical protein
MTVFFDFELDERQIRARKSAWLPIESAKVPQHLGLQLELEISREVGSENRHEITATT